METPERIRKRKHISLDKIWNMCCEEMDVHSELAKSKSRIREYAYTRYMFVILCLDNNLGYSTKTLSWFFGREHALYWNAGKNIDRIETLNDPLSVQYNKIWKRIKVRFAKMIELSPIVRRDYDTDNV